MLSEVNIYIYVIFVFVVCAIIIANTRTPSKALAYLFLVLVMPVVGAVVYFAVGFDYRKRKLYDKKIDLDHDAFPEMVSSVEAYSKDMLQQHKEDMGQYHSMAMSQNFRPLISANNAIEVLHNGETKFPKVLEDLQAAKHHIHIQYYIYANDKIGNAIADICEQKAKEGVKVRFIYDDFGSNGVQNTIAKRLKAAGAEVFPFYKITLLKFANRINYRNHRKIIVIDGEVGYTGGINVSDKYINTPDSKLYWRDTSMRIDGLSVMNLQLTFIADWNFCASQNVGFSTELFPIDNKDKKIGDKIVQIVASGPDTDYPTILYTYIQAILLAQKEIILTTPYFVPDKSFLDALKIASQSGVEIKILVPGVSDSVFVNAVSQSFYSELLEIGVRIFEYNKGFVHAKTAIFDSYVTFIGTTNLDNRSFDLNFEVNAVVYDKETATGMRAVYEEDLQSATELVLEDWNNRATYRKAFERVSRLFAPLV